MPGAPDAGGNPWLSDLSDPESGGLLLWGWSEYGLGDFCGGPARPIPTSGPWWHGRKPTTTEDSTAVPASSCCACSRTWQLGYPMSRGSGHFFVSYGLPES